MIQTCFQFGRNTVQLSITNINIRFYSNLRWNSFDEYLRFEDLHTFLLFIVGINILRTNDRLFLRPLFDGERVRLERSKGIIGRTIRTSYTGCRNTAPCFYSIHPSRSTREATKMLIFLLVSIPVKVFPQESSLE